MDENQIIADNMGLVYHFLGKFNRLQDDEAFSFAMEALMNAVRTYDENKQIKFSTYASACIYNAIAYYLRPLNNKKRVEVISYDTPVKGQEDLTYLDILQSSVSPVDILLNDELSTRIQRAISSVLSGISNKTTIAIIKYWQSTDFTVTQKDIANTLGIAQPTVSRAINMFRYRMKLELRDYL